MPTDNPGISALTDRQKEILILIAQGYQPKEIAPILRMASSTVRGHTEEIRKKLGVSSTRTAARIYVSSPEYLALRQNDGGEKIRVVSGAEIAPSSGHEQNHSDHKRTHLDDPQERSGGGHVDTGDGNKGAYDTSDLEHHIQGEGGGRGNRSGIDADVRLTRFDRYLALIARLKKLNLFEWAGLTLAVTLMIVIATGSVVVVLMGVFQAITNFSGRTG